MTGAISATAPTPCAIGNVGTPDRAKRQQIVKGQTGVRGSHQHQRRYDHAWFGVSNNREYLVVVNVLECMRQREYGDRGNGQADDDTQTLQSGSAAMGLLQHNGLQGAHQSGQQY